MIGKFLKNIDFNRDMFVAYLRLAVGGYFLYASLDKIIDPYAFARVIEAYEFSSSIGLSSLDTLLALILPWLELMLGVFLIIGTFIDEAINIIIGLLLFFIIMLFQAHLKGLDISCGCTAGESSLGEAIIRDFALLFASLIIKFRRFFLRTKYVS
tara:strand:+ start:216 stop:680 length:465 start_codon:yes stop_codon:yes gene_type:complete